MKYLIILNLLLVFLVSCSSRKLQKDYVVVDSSHQDVPEWVEDLDEWIEDEEKNKNRYRYFTYTSDPKNDRQISCDLASARAGTYIAGEISQTIKQNIESFKNGDPNSKNEKLDQYVEEKLSKVIQAKLVGVKTYKTYWEKRRFQKELGAKKNKDAYTCTKLLKVPKSDMKKMFAVAYKNLDKMAKNDVQKDVVKKAIEKSEKELK